MATEEKLIKRYYRKDNRYKLKFPSLPSSLLSLVFLLNSFFVSVITSVA